MAFVKFVILYDVIIGFLVILYRLYLNGMSSMDKVLYSMRPTTKTAKTLGLLLVLALLLSFVAALIFLIHVMF